jgi:RNA polymerase sigma-70 factor (ECF subfamily)
MLNKRTNEEWLQELESNGETRAAAVDDLRQILLRTALYVFSRKSGDTGNLDRGEIIQMAEDCAQEALIAVMKHLSDFRGDSKFTTWVYKFAVNTSLMALRRERWKDISLDQVDEMFLITNQRAYDPELPGVRWEIRELLRNTMLNELTERQQRVLKLIVFDEVPMDVVVERMETNRNAVYKLLHDARLKIKQKLLESGFGIDETMEIFSSGR